MNCVECRDNLVAYAEGLLEQEDQLRCQTHLETCDSCRAEYHAIGRLQQRLCSRAQAVADAAIIEPVMRRIRAEQKEPERNVIMSLLIKYRWGFGLGAALAVAMILMSPLSTPRIQAAAAEVMSKGAQLAANLKSIHLRGQLRTAPRDNFSAIMPDQDFVTVELWKEFQPEVKWRVEKPGRVAVMDGHSTVLFIKPDYALKVGQATSSAFDTQWLHEIANPNQILTSELSAAKVHGWPVTLAQEQGSDGRPKSVVTVEAKSGLMTGDYLKNKFFGTADTRRVYVFDNESEQLEAVRVYLHGEGGAKLVFKLDEIDYNQPIDPSVFQLQLPTHVVWEQPMQILPDNQKYAAMKPEEAARAFFEACGRQDWNEAGKFCTITSGLKEELGGIEVVSIGQPFTSAISLINGAQFVPYEIRFKNGELKKFNLALKRDSRTQRWYVDGGI